MKIAVGVLAALHALITTSPGVAQASDEHDPAEPVVINYSGSGALLVKTVDLTHSTALAINIVGSGRLPDTPVTQSGHLVSANDSYTLTVSQAIDLTNALGAWLQNATTGVVYMLYGPSYSLTVAGVNEGPSFQTINFDIFRDCGVGPGKTAGESATTLHYARVQDLHAALSAWVANPVPQNEPIFRQQYH
jgi:hypothetical protein